MKKIFTITTIILFVFMIVSCGGSKPNSIIFLTNRTDLKNTLLKDAKREFETLYVDKGYTVRIETISDYENVVTTRLSGKNYGDVLLIPQTVEPKNLSSFFVSYGSKDELSEKGYTGLNAKAFNNEVYGIPIGLQSAGLLINLDVFNKASINPADLIDPISFLNAMIQINDYGKEHINDFKGAFYTHAATGWGLTQWAAGITTAAGSKDYMNLVLPWDNKAFYDNDLNEVGIIGKLYGLLFDLITNDVVESSPTVDAWEESKIWFSQGKIAAMAVGSWAIEQFDQAAEEIEAGLSANVGYMPYPFKASNNNIYASLSADYTIGIAKNSKNKELANLFVKWLINDFNYPSKTGNIPPKVNALYPEKIQSFQDAGVILVEETAAPVNLEGALSLAEKNAQSSMTDEKRIVLWDSVWITDFVTKAFDVRDNRSNATKESLLKAIQTKWDNGVLAVNNTYGEMPNAS